LAVLGTGRAFPGQPIATRELLDCIAARFEVNVVRRGLAAARRLNIRQRHLARSFERRVEGTRPGDGNPETMKISIDGSEPEILPEVVGGSHMSLSPDHSLIMDVIGHKTLWVSPLVSGKPEKVFEFDDPDVRIDYPVWSPDGKWVLFDRFRPQGGDIWMMENIE